MDATIIANLAYKFPRLVNIITYGGYCGSFPGSVLLKFG